MELVEGRSLADAVKEEERVEPREAARIGLWVLRALRAAHAAGVLHRDVKPGNVLLADDGRVLLTDFGIAQIEGDSTITRTGEVVGSVDYLAPERVRGHDPGPASDLWALGATLYTAVEGRSPFRRTSPLTTMQAVVEEEATEPRYAGPLAPVIDALLRKDPATRPDVTEAEQMLAEAAEGRRPRSAQAYVPTQYSGPSRQDGTVHPGATGPAGGSAATPYRTTTGPTAVGPVPSGHPGTGPVPTGPTAVGHPPASAAPRRRRRLRTVALVVAVAALIGAGTAVMLQQRDDGGSSAGPDPAHSPSASSSATETRAPVAPFRPTGSAATTRWVSAFTCPRTGSARTSAATAANSGRSTTPPTAANTSCVSPSTPLPTTTTRTRTSWTWRCSSSGWSTTGASSWNAPTTATATAPAGSTPGPRWPRTPPSPDPAAPCRRRTCPGTVSSTP